MKISIFQMRAEKGRVRENLTKVEDVAKKAALSGSDVLLLPEYFATGFDLKRLAGLATGTDEGVFAEISRIAGENRIAITGASPSQDKGRMYNTAFYFNKQGKLVAKYNKMHLFSVMNENDYFYAGSDSVVFDTEFGKAGIICCFDLRFPELARRLTLDGAKIIFIPAFWPEPRLEHWKILVQARAIENLVYVAVCNSASLSESQQMGFSQVIGPDGGVLTKAGKDEILLNAEVDINKVDEVRDKFPALSLRRSGEYGQF